MDEHRLLHKAIVQGGLLIDAPTGKSLGELKELAKDKSLWKSLRGNIEISVTRTESRKIHGIDSLEIYLF